MPFTSTSGPTGSSRAPFFNCWQSVQAALSSECARDQGRFWEYHDLLFEHEGAYEPEALSGLASSLHLNVDSFQECLQSGKYTIEVKKDKLDGKAAGVTGTPSFFVNGRFLSGSVEPARLREILDQELTATKKEAKR